MSWLKNVIGHEMFLVDFWAIDNIKDCTKTECKYLQIPVWSNCRSNLTLGLRPFCGRWVSGFSFCPRPCKRSEPERPPLSERLECCHRTSHWKVRSEWPIPSTRFKKPILWLTVYSSNNNNCVFIGWQRPVNLDWLPSNRGFPVLPDHVVDHGSWIWPTARDPIPPSSSGWCWGTVEGPSARRRRWRRGRGNHSNSETQSHPAARETKAFIRPHMEGSMQI